MPHAPNPRLEAYLPNSGPSQVAEHSGLCSQLLQDLELSTSGLETTPSPLGHAANYTGTWLIQVDQRHSMSQILQPTGWGQFHLPALSQ